MRRRHSLLLAGSIGAVASGAVLLVGPPSETAEVIRQLRMAGKGADEQTVRTYPPGRWRLQDPVKLTRIVVWVSHLLIRYEGSPGQEVPFSPSQWQSEPPPPTRTRDEAIELADKLALDALKVPAAFPALVSQYSDDVVTRDTGGSLGGITASQFLEEPQVLDALAATSVGTVTRPVETRYGFHIFYRRPAPEERSVSGTHIVIGHDDARWLHEVVARREVPRRSREEALALARQVHDTLTLFPKRIHELVAQYSDHRDAEWGGDFGEWSTQEPTPFPREVETLQNLQVHEAADPIDTVFGFQVIYRTPNRLRKEYAMRALQLRFDPQANGADASSREAVLREAELLAQRIGPDPSQFDEELRHRCCAGVARWQEGKDYSSVNGVLDELDVGQIAPRPVEWDFSYLIAQRVDPAMIARISPVSSELSAEADPDVGYFVSHVAPKLAQHWLMIVADTFCTKAGLPGELRSQILELHRAWQDLPVDTDLEQRKLHFGSLLSGVERLVGSDVFLHYLEIMHQQFASWALDVGFPSAMTSTGTSN